MAIIAIARQVGIIDGFFARRLMLFKYPAQLFVIVFRLVEIAGPELWAQLAVEHSFKCGHGTVVKVGGLGFGVACNSVFPLGAGFHLNGSFFKRKGREERKEDAKGAIEVCSLWFVVCGYVPYG